MLHYYERPSGFLKAQCQIMKFDSTIAAVTHGKALMNRCLKEDGAGLKCRTAPSSFNSGLS